jgi:hypothetical protein
LRARWPRLSQHPTCAHSGDALSNGLVEHVGRSYLVLAAWIAVSLAITARVVSRRD